MNVPKKIESAILLLIISLAASCCSTTQIEQPEELPEGLRAKKEQILSNYNPSNCFVASFNISIQNAEGSRSAVGEVRSDPANRRLHLEFRVPYIGIKLSQLTILEETAYVKNVQMDRMETIPVSMLQVQGMGQNSIQLPFSLFQELLYAGLPKNVSNVAKWSENQDGSVSARISDADSTIAYHFESGHLQQIQYNKQQTAESIRVDLKGLRSKEPSIPSRLSVEARKAGGAPEMLILDFTGVNARANCSLQQFPTSF